MSSMFKLCSLLWLAASPGRKEVVAKHTARRLFGKLCADT